MTFVPAILVRQRALIFDYASALSGSAGRLVFSLLYFVVLANTLTISDFGLFATASAAGIVLSRILGFGFVSPLYRVATVRRRLLGAYTAGFVLMALLSLPLLAAAAFGVHFLFFAGTLPLAIFALIIVSETLLWRPAEVTVIVNNGVNRFARGAVLVILGTVSRAAAAVLFAVTGEHALDLWVWWYLLANALTLFVAIFFFYPACRLRLAPRIYGRRMRDALGFAGADLLFYVQMEMDKLLVLAIAGPSFAGLYAIIMRLIDLTALPIRAFCTLLVQKIMRTPEFIERIGLRVGLEAAVFSVSVAAIASLAGLLYLWPGLLGSQVALAAPLVPLALLVPGLRNLVEYQAELLYARGQMMLRILNLAILGALKAVLLVFVLTHFDHTRTVVIALNGVFFALYAASMLLTYSALRLPARPV